MGRPSTGTTVVCRLIVSYTLGYRLGQTLTNADSNTSNSWRTYRCWQCLHVSLMSREPSPRAMEVTIWGSVQIILHMVIEASRMITTHPKKLRGIILHSLCLRSCLSKSILKKRLADHILQIPLSAQMICLQATRPPSLTSLLVQVLNTKIRSQRVYLPHQNITAIRIAQTQISAPSRLSLVLFPSVPQLPHRPTCIPKSVRVPLGAIPQILLLRLLGLRLAFWVDHPRSRKTPNLPSRCLSRIPRRMSFLHRRSLSSRPS